MTFTVKYHEIDHAVAQEVSVTVTTGEDVASLIFFTGRRAVDKVVPEFGDYAVHYTPCYVYWNVPLDEIQAFLERWEVADTTDRKRFE